MKNYRKQLTTKFEYKYLFYSISFISLNIGLCNAYLKKKREKYKDEQPKLYFFLDEKNYEILDKPVYSKRIQKICDEFQISLDSLSHAAKNYFPLDYHLQVIDNILKKNKEKLSWIVKNDTSSNILETLIKEVELCFEDSIKGNVKTDKSPVYFLRELDFSHLKEFIEKRKQINANKRDYLEQFLNEVYIYVYLYMVTNYKRNNFFDFIKIKRAYRHCSENCGKDIGLEVNSYLGFSNNKEKNRTTATDQAEKSLNTEQNMNYVKEVTKVLSIETVDEVMNSLRKYGVVVLKKVIPKEDIDKIKKELFLQEKDKNVYAYLLNKDQNIFSIRPSRGRQYCILRNSKLSDVFVNIQQNWINMIYSYLPVGIFDNLFTYINKEMIVNKSIQLTNFHLNTEHYEKLYLSELQLINNEALSDVQSYHVDNGASGISVLLPLDKMNRESGNFEFFLGSHNLNSINKEKLKKKVVNFKRFFDIYCKTGSSFVPEIEEQDIVIYDSKILHRGLSNNLWYKNSSLIYRYDYLKYPPPNQDFIDIFTYNILGKCITFFNYLSKYI